MKTFSVSMLFILVYSIFLVIPSKSVKQACERRTDQMLCGDVCLETDKLCYCGNTSFTVSRKPIRNTKVCCVKEGECLKDSVGTYFECLMFVKILCLNMFWCLGNGHCLNGKIQEEGSVCNGLCPIAVGYYVSVPCKNSQTGAIHCSDLTTPNAVCRGKSTNLTKYNSHDLLCPE